MPLPSSEQALAARVEDHYAVLGLSSPRCSLEEVRAAYKQLSLTAHPDKRRAEYAMHKGGGAKARAEAQREWMRIEHAHEILSDEITRAMYDIEFGVVEDTAENHARIARLKRKEALLAVSTMEETVALIRAREQAANGLVITQARYGDLEASMSQAGKAVHSPFIDVAVPLQCLVHDSSLIIGGGRSRFWLEGFWDPSLGANPGANRLYIQYRFLGRAHEATFDDEEPVAIPMREHCMDEEEQEEQQTQGNGDIEEERDDQVQADEQAEEEAEAEAMMAAARKRASLPRARSRLRYSLSSASLQKDRLALLAKQKRRRRMMLYTGVALAGIFIYTRVAKGRMPAAVVSAQNRVGSWAQWAANMLKQRFWTPAMSAHLVSVQQQAAMLLSSYTAGIVTFCSRLPMPALKVGSAAAVVPPASQSVLGLQYAPSGRPL